MTERENPPFNIERILPTHMGEELMIKISIGDQFLLLSENDAYEFARQVEDQATMTDFENHLDHALEGWGEEGEDS